MASKIDPTQINTGFPVSGINQSSAGFRSNFSAIRTQFSTANLEISAIQATGISVTGDIQLSGASPVLGQSSGISLNLKLKTLLTNSLSVDSSSQDVQYVVGTNGLITSMTVTQKTKYSGDASTSYSVKQNSMDANYPDATGMQSITVPTLTISDYGVVQSQSSSTISGFGVLGYSMPQGALMTGSASNVSTYMPVGTTGDFLVADSTSPTGLSWKAITYGQGQVMDITTGVGLQTTGTAANPIIELDLNSLTEVTALNSTDELLITRTDGYTKATLSDLTSLYLDNVYIKTIVQDTNPTLGGNLSTGNFSIQSDSNLVLKSGTTNNIVLNNFVWPLALPSNSSYLTVDSTGSGVWSPITNGMKTLVADTGIKIDTDSTGSTIIGFDPSTIVDSTSISSTTNVLVYDTKSSITSLVPSSVFGTSISGIIYVSPSGSDTTGDGRIGTPFATITHALSVAVAKDTIILMPGYYGENVTIETSSITIKSYSSNLSSQIGGNVIIGSGTTGLGYTIFDSIWFQAASGTSIATGSTVTDSITFDNCIISSADTSNTQAGPSVTFTGSLGDRVDFTNCSISGIVSNEFTSGTVYITNSNGIYDYETRVVTATGSTTILTNITKMLSITHNGGSIYCYNIGQIFDSYNPSTGTTSTTYPSITSTSSGTSDLMVLANVSLYSPDYKSYATIDKTGTCGYILRNVDRLQSADTLKGVSTYVTDNWDLGHQVKELTQVAAATYTIDTSYKCVSLPIGNQITLTLSAPNFTENNPYEYDFRLILIGTGSGKVSFDSSVTGTNGVDLYMDNTDNSYTVYDFRWIPFIGSWLCLDVTKLNQEGNVNLLLSSLTIGSENEPAKDRALNFSTSGNGSSYDSRIYASGPSTSAGNIKNGSGTIEIESSLLAIDGQVNIKNNAMNLGIQASAGATYIGMYSSGGSYADGLIQSYGGSTTEQFQGTMTLSTANLTISAPYIDLTGATSGVMCPSTSNDGLTLGDNSAKAATTEWCNGKFVPSIVSGTQSIVTNFYYDGTNDAVTFNSEPWSGFMVSTPATGTANSSDYSVVSIGVTPTGNVPYFYQLGSGKVNLVASPAAGESTDLQVSSIGITATGSVPYFYQLGSGKVNLAVASSAMKLKKNINDSLITTKDALDDINSIPLKSFEWKSDNRKVSMGMIAEELEKVCPELVNKDDSEDGADSVNFLNLMARMVGAIQELTARVNELENKQ